MAYLYILFYDFSGSYFSYLQTFSGVFLLKVLCVGVFYSNYFGSFLLFSIVYLLIFASKPANFTL